MNNNLTFLIGNAVFAGALTGWAYINLDWPGAVVGILVSFAIGRMMREKL